MTENIFPKVHNEGYKFIIIFALVTIILYFINGFLGILGLLLTIWCYYFFRDPERISIQDDNYLTSPADGVVIEIQETTGPKELQLENKKYTKISIFMNVFDCHVNRTPCSGIISEILYKLENLLMHLLTKRVKIMKEIIIKLKIIMTKILWLYKLLVLLQEGLYVRHQKIKV